MANKMNLKKNAITKESIFTALMIVMEKKDFHKISITELTARAGVSRMAFYRNYAILEDVLIDHLTDFFSKCEEQLISIGLEDTYEVMHMFFSSFRTEKRFMMNLIDSNLAHLLLERSNSYLLEMCKELVCDKSYSPEKERYVIKFMVGGFFNATVEWFQDGLQQSDEYMAQLLYEYCV